MDMNRYILTISELAKLKNITSETLRYYDRIGLLKPVHISEGGHRYYSIRQYEKLGTILELKEIGMPLKEIQEYFENRNLKKSYEILEMYQKKFEKKLKEQIYLNEVLLQKLDFIRSLSELPKLETIFEENFPTRYMVTFGKRSGNREEHAMAFTKLEKYLKEKIPIIASDRVGVFTDEKLLVPSGNMVPGVPMLLVAPENADGTYLKEIQKGTYVCMLYKNGLLEKYHSSFEKIKAYVYEKGYKINGPILQIYKVDITLTNDEEEAVLEIQVPVEERKF